MLHDGRLHVGVVLVWNRQELRDARVLVLAAVVVVVPVDDVDQYAVLHCPLLLDSLPGFLVEEHREIAACLIVASVDIANVDENECIFGNAFLALSTDDTRNLLGQRWYVSRDRMFLLVWIVCCS